MTADPTPLDFLPEHLTRAHVLHALRHIEQEALRLPAGTVYDLVFESRRYPPRAVAQLAYRLATDQPQARWPLPSGSLTNALLERLDFTIATKRPTLANSPQDGSVAEQQQLPPNLYAGRAPEKPTAGKPAPTLDIPAAPVAAEPLAPYPGPPRPYDRTAALAELFIPENQLDAALAALHRRQNLILQGPPGTGKTYLAQRLAWLLLGGRDASRLELVQFHASYSYEDFVQGFRPDAQGTFRLQDGLLPEVCRRATQAPDRPYILLIDELNRGNVGRIFGELLLLLEADKRGPDHAVRLPYAPAEAPRFFVPPNLYVIGTMNTADRSLAPLDFALRRRFAFLDLEPVFGSPLQEYLLRQQVPRAVVERLTNRLTALNQTITDDPDLGPGFRLGHSYFCQPPTPPASAETWLTLLFEQEIAPLLAEYWLDDPQKATAQRLRLLQ